MANAELQSGRAAELDAEAADETVDVPRATCLQSTGGQPGPGSPCASSEASKDGTLCMVAADSFGPQPPFATPSCGSLQESQPSDPQVAPSPRLAPGTPGAASAITDCASVASQPRVPSAPSAKRNSSDAGLSDNAQSKKTRRTAKEAAVQSATEALRAAKKGYSWINHFERRRRTRGFRSVLQRLGGHGRTLGDFKHDDLDT